MLTREQTNFLMQCCRTAHFGDGATFLARPLRASLYRWKLRTTASVSASRITIPDPSPPTFDSAVHTLFADPPRPGERLPDEPRLLVDAQSQLQGLFRLAGGAIRPIRTGDGGAASLLSLNDPEDRHSWHRLYWAVRYAEAAALGLDDASSALHRELAAWLESVPSAEAQAAYTISERICCLAEVLFWAPSLSGALIHAIKDRVYCDAFRLSRSFEYHLGIHNHLLNNARGLHAAAVLLPSCHESRPWREQAFQVWDRYFPLLLLRDGSFAEQSSHYHLLLCRTALEYALASRRADRPLPAGLSARFAGMFRLADDLLRADGTLPRFGDNSPDHTVQDLWGLLTAAYAHHLLDRAPRHLAFTSLSRYYGAAGTPSGSRPTEPCHLYPNGGFAFLRAEDAGVELSAHADPRVETAVHGDCGLGSFELWGGGKVIIREPGCFLRHADPRSVWYRSAEAQNVTSVEGLPPTILLEDQLRMPAWYWHAAGEWSNPDPGTIRFETSCFRRLGRDLTFIRTWTLPPDGGLLFEELIAGTGTVRLRSRIFPGDGPWATGFVLQDGHWTLHRDPQAGPPVSIRLTLPLCIAPALLLAHVMPEYGIERPALAIVLSGRTTLPCRWRLRVCTDTTTPPQKGI